MPCSCRLIYTITIVIAIVCICAMDKSVTKTSLLHHHQRRQQSHRLVLMEKFDRGKKNFELFFVFLWKRKTEWANALCVYSSVIHVTWYIFVNEHLNLIHNYHLRQIDINITERKWIPQSDWIWICFLRVVDFQWIIFVFHSAHFAILNLFPTISVFRFEKTAWLIGRQPSGARRIQSFCDRLFWRWSCNSIIKSFNEWFALFWFAGAHQARLENVKLAQKVSTKRN